MPKPVRVRRLITDRQYIDRGVRSMAGVAGATNRYKVKPKTPMLTGELRLSISSRTRAIPDGNIETMFIAAAPHAIFLEDPVRAATLVNFTTPGTRAPFLEPGVREGIAAYLPKAVGSDIFGGL